MTVRPVDVIWVTCLGTAKLRSALDECGTLGYRRLDGRDRCRVQ